MTRRDRNELDDDDDDDNNHNSSSNEKNKVPSSEPPINSADHRFIALRKSLEDAFFTFLTDRNPINDQTKNEICAEAKNLLSKRTNSLSDIVDCEKFNSEIGDFQQNNASPVGTLIHLCNLSGIVLTRLIREFRLQAPCLKSDDVQNALRDQLVKIINETPKTIFSQLDRSINLFGVFPNVYIKSDWKPLLGTRNVTVNNSFHFVASIGNSTASSVKFAHPLPTDDDERRVLVVGGSSGSGKTLYSLGCAHNHKVTKNLESRMPENSGSNIIIYLVAKDIVDAGWKEPDWEAQSHDPDKKPRDDAASFYIQKAIFDVLSSYGVPGEVPADVILNADDHKRKLIIIIDEIGPTPNLLRALCSIGARLSAFLHTKYLDAAGGKTTKILSQERTTTFSNRVCFIAAGTGADCASDWASQPRQTAHFRFLDETEADLFSALLEKFLVDNPQLRDRLRRLCPSSSVSATAASSSTIMNTSSPASSSSSASSSLSTVERLAADLVKNRRAAALFLRYLVNQPDYYTQLVTSHQHLFEQRLMSLMTAVVIEFMSLNGLSKFRKPLNVLVASVAVAAHRVDVSKMKKEKLSEEAKVCMMKFFAPFHSESSSSLQVDDLHSILCTNGGVLVSESKVNTPDNSLVTTNGNNISSIQNESENSVARSSHDDSNAALLPQIKQEENDEQQPRGTMLMIKNTNDDAAQSSSSSTDTPHRRFLLSPPYAAMTRILLGVPTRDASWSGFELRCADYCLMLACASEFCHNVLEITPQIDEQRQRDQINAAAAAAAADDDDEDADDSDNNDGADTSQQIPVSKEDDRQAQRAILQRLREWLVFGGTAVGVEMLQMQERVIDMEEQAELQKELKVQLQALLRRRFAVVLMFAPREPFADLAVFGPDGSIILIQCKYRQAATPIEFAKEFAKMGFGKTKNRDHTNASNFAGFLSNTVIEVTNNNARVRAAIMCECADSTIKTSFEKKYTKFKSKKKLAKWNDIDFFCWTDQQSKTVLYPIAATATTTTTTTAAEHSQGGEEKRSCTCSAACFSSSVEIPKTIQQGV